MARAKKVKIAYAGGKRHEYNVPGNADGMGFVIRFDDEAKAEITADQWKQLEPHAANAGISKL